MRFLFIGNSHTYFNDLPRLLCDIWEANIGELAESTMLAYSSRPIDWHSSEYFSVRYNLLYGNYDYCIIQQKANPFPGKGKTLSGLEPILRLCRESCTTPVLYEPWSIKPKISNQPSVDEAYKEICEETGCLVAPVGQIFTLIHKNLPEISLYRFDGEHASPEGDFLVASVLFSTISGRKMSVLPCHIYDFLKGKKLDFSHPEVIESADSCNLNIPEATMKSINAVVNSILKV